MGCGASNISTATSGIPSLRRLNRTRSSPFAGRSRVCTWCRQEGGCRLLPRMQIFVSDEYKIAKSRGRLWVIEAEWNFRPGMHRRAAVVHELVRLFSQRQSISGRGVSPSICKPRSRIRLPEPAGRCTGRTGVAASLLPSTTSGSRKPPRQHPSPISTRSPPESTGLRVGGSVREHAHRSGASSHQPALLRSAPDPRRTEPRCFVRCWANALPDGRNPARPSWADAYGRPLLETELEWKSMIVSC